jgi:hypothetical protein
MKKIENTLIRQGNRIKELENTLSVANAECLRFELDDAPKYDFPLLYVWEVIRYYESIPSGKASTLEEAKQ